METLRGLAILLSLQAAGEVLTRAVRLPLPGPVVGLVLLLAVLHVEAVRAPTAAVAEQLLSHLSLLFIPVGVGVITRPDLLARHAVPLLVAVALSTWIGMIVTAVVLKALLGRMGKPQRP